MRSAQDTRHSQGHLSDQHRLAGAMAHLSQVAETFRNATDVAPIKTETVDFLSGLANRQNFNQALNNLVAETGAEFSVMLIDVDHFKQINDRYGHNIGDEVIRQVSNRLRSVATTCSLVARLGGDEFGLIIPDPSSQEACETEMLAGKLLDAFKAPLDIDGVQLLVGCSLGAARFPEHATSANDLVGKADLALYHAKSQGRNLWIDYFDALGVTAARTARLCGDLRHAIHAEEIVPYFQGIYDLTSHRLDGFEVLARWHHPTLGLVGANEFISQAARLGLAADLTLSVIRQSILYARHWPQSIKLSFNITADEVCSTGFATGFLQLLDELKFEPSRCRIEITEQALVRHLSAAQHSIEVLRARGVLIFLDDFGSGYSGLSYLRDLVIDGIKIDKGFANEISPGCRGWRILSGILSLARELSLAVVVEGIETQAALQNCVMLKIEQGQGYHFNSPQPGSDITFPAP